MRGRDTHSKTEAVVVDPDSALRVEIGDLTGAPYLVQLALGDTWTTIGAYDDLETARRHCLHILRSSERNGAARVVLYPDPGDDEKIYKIVFEARGRLGAPWGATLASNHLGHRRPRGMRNRLSFFLWIVAAAGLLTAIVVMHQSWFGVPLRSERLVGASAIQSHGRSVLERYPADATETASAAVEIERPTRGNVTAKWMFSTRPVALMRDSASGDRLVYDGRTIFRTADALNLRTIVRFEPFEVAVLEVEARSGDCRSRTLMFAVNAGGATQLEGPFGGCHASFFVTTVEKRILVAFPQPGSEPMHLYLWRWGERPHRIGPDQISR